MQITQEKLFQWLGELYAESRAKGEAIAALEARLVEAAAAAAAAGAAANPAMAAKRAEILAERAAGAPPVAAAQPDAALPAATEGTHGDE